MFSLKIKATAVTMFAAFALACDRANHSSFWYCACSTRACARSIEAHACSTERWRKRGRRFETPTSQWLDKRTAFIQHASRTI